MTGGWGRRGWALVALLLAAWALRLPPLVHAPLHPDEALYGSWGLSVGYGQDPWLSGSPVDKPPLLLYTLAGSQLLFGHRMGLRLPGLAAGLLTVPLVYALAAALFRDHLSPAVAALAVAFAPLAVVLSGTGFPDPLMIALGLAACVAVVRKHIPLAGVLLGLSFATKQTGLVWLPLSAAIFVLHPGRMRRDRALLSFAGCFSLVVGLIFAWDAVRVLQGARSYWQAGITGYGGLRFIRPRELVPRFQQWLAAGRYLFASAPIHVLILAGIPAVLWAGLVERRDSRRPLTYAALVSFLAIYVLLHWFVAFPVWDRYLLTLVPVLALILGVTVCRVARWAGSGARWVPLGLAALLTAFLTVPAVQASAGRYPIARERDRYHGIDDVTAFLARRPAGTVVYHHWLGWHYRHALWEAPLHLAYWPNPEWLARDVQAFGQSGPRFIAFPAWESSARVEHHLSDVGYRLATRLTVVGAEGRMLFTVYELVPSPP